MKSNKIEFDGNGDGEIDRGIHFIGPIGDYTLCGITMDGDRDTAGTYKKTAKKVDCDHCLTILNYCKKLKQ